MAEITLAPVIPNAIYQVSEDGGKTWSKINLSDKGEVLMDIKPNWHYHFRVMPKKRKRIKKANK